MKVSIITVSYNSAKTIEKTIRSVIEQTYSSIEYIIIDGASTDDTLAIVDKYKTSITTVISEKDKGIYDAFNKGLSYASGDVIGILNSDDFYTHREVIQQVVNTFEKGSYDAVYGDLQYVDNRTGDEKIFRTWKAGAYSDGLFLKGWMPPHPAFFVKRTCYEKYGNYNIALNLAADYELMLRLIHKHKIKLGYLPEIIVKMSIGGESNASVFNRLKANYQDRLAWKLNGLQPDFLTLYLKPLSKIRQFLQR